jgi:hypothetical protein
MRKTTNILLIFGLIVFVGFLVVSITDASVYLQELLGRYAGPNNPLYRSLYRSATTEFTEDSIIIGASGRSGVSGAGTGVWYCIVCPSPSNHPPTATNLNKTDCDWCVNPFQFRLSWTFTDPDGDSQGAKQIQVSRFSDFRQITFDSGKVENSVQAYTIPATGSGLEFNKTYYWRLKVWDTKGGESNWINAPDSQKLVTPEHAYPDPDFSWQPENPDKDQPVQFTDQSRASGGARISRWSWTFQDGNPSTSQLQNPRVIFSTEGKKRVQLTVWDFPTNYSCSVEKEVKVGVFAPLWREIAPW